MKKHLQNIIYGEKKQNSEKQNKKQHKKKKNTGTR